jgi:hypothetical protein
MGIKKSNPKKQKQKYSKTLKTQYQFKTQNWGRILILLNK